MLADAPRRQIFRRLLQEPTTVVGLVLIVFFALLALTAPVLSPYDPLFQNISASLTPPSPAYLLGTDKLGRDLLSRMLYGARISLRVGLIVVVSAGTLGALVSIARSSPRIGGRSRTGIPPGSRELSFHAEATRTVVPSTAAVVMVLMRREIVIGRVGERCESDISMHKSRFFRRPTPSVTD